MSIYTTNNRLKQILETTKGSTIGMGGVTFLIIVLMIFFAVLPAYRSITDQLKNNEAKTKYLEELKKKKLVLDKLAVSYQNNLPQIEYFDLYNNPIANTETLVANIDSIATINNSILKDITISRDSSYESPDASPFIESPSFLPQGLTMSFDTKIGNIPSLIKSLEEFPLTLFINSTTINQKSRTETDLDTGPLAENDIIRITIEGELYFWNKD